MDVFASRLQHALAYAAVAAILLSACGAVAAVIHLTRRPSNDPALKKGVAIWTAIMLPFLLLCGGSLILNYSSAWHSFDRIMSRKPNRLIITSEGKTNEINDAVVIAKFFRIVTEGPNVGAHHSHPVSDVRLFFPQSGYIYSLGRDSQYTNEFWFEWEGIAGRSGDRLGISGSLGRVRSDQLAEWVRKYSP